VGLDGPAAVAVLAANQIAADFLEQDALRGFEKL